MLQLAIFAGRQRAAAAQALGRDLKGKLSPLIYLAGIALAFVETWLSVAVFVFAALVWLVPDRRIERFLASESAGPA